MHYRSQSIHAAPLTCLGVFPQVSILFDAGRMCQTGNPRPSLPRTVCPTRTLIAAPPTRFALPRSRSTVVYSFATSKVRADCSNLARALVTWRFFDLPLHCVSLYLSLSLPRIPSRGCVSRSLCPPTWDMNFDKAHLADCGPGHRCRSQHWFHVEGSLSRHSTAVQGEVRPF